MLVAILTLFFFFLPFQFALSPDEGIDLALARVVALLLGMGWLVKSLAERRLSIPAVPQTVFLLSFLFLALFSLFFAEASNWGMRKIIFLLSFVPLYFVASDVLREKKMLHSITIAVVAGASVAALIGLVQFGLQFIIGIDPTLHLWNHSLLPFFLGDTFSQTVAMYPSQLAGIGEWTLVRATAFFPDPHIFSFYLGMALPLAVALVFAKPRYWFLFGCLSLLLFTADLLTFSRGGYVGLLGGFVFLIFLILRGASRNYRRGAAALCLVLVLGLAVPSNPVTERLLTSFNTEEGSNLGRIAMWQEAARAIREAPLTGVGLGSFPLFAKPSAEYREPIYAHSLYLDIAAEMGVTALGVFLALILTAISSLVRAGKTDQLFLGAAASLIIFATHSIVETPLFSVHILPLILLLLSISTVAKTYAKI